LAPSETPSVSPSQSLFGFLAEHSFDNGTALSTTGSSQKRHLQGWRSKSTLYNSATDYVVLQFYVLAVFNYATGDLLSGESWLHDNGTASEYNFCDWDNTDCNDGRTDITALSPLGSQLFGSLTPEIACCLIIPWNRPCHMRLIADYFFLHSVRCPPPHHPLCLQEQRQDISANNNQQLQRWWWSCRSYDIMILDNLPFPQLYTFFDNEPETSSLKSLAVPEILCFDEVTFSSKKLPVIYCKLTSWIEIWAIVFCYVNSKNLITITFS